MPAIESKPKPKHKIPEQAERGSPKKAPSVPKVDTKPKPKVKSAEREIVYPKPGATLYAVGSNSGPLTADAAKELLGWEEVKKDFCREVNSAIGIKAVLNNNISNRPIYGSTIQTLCQEILRKRWQLNGEPIILGKTGLVLNGQHTLLSLIAAHHDWEENPDAYPEWTEPPTIDKFVNVGIEEDDSIVNTMDTCKPRSLADVIYRSHYFDKMESVDRRKCAKICDYAVRMIWNRTGIGNAFELRRTHSESLAFIENHPKLLECVKFCYEEEGDGADSAKISCYINVGYAAALMYLMGSSATDPSEYQDSDNPNENMLNWDNWEKACDFWVSLAASEQSTSGLKKFFNHHLREHGVPGLKDKCYMIAKAWTLFATDGNTKAMSLAYEENEEGVRCLVEFPTAGGIDIGEPGDAVDTARSNHANKAKQAPEEEADDIVEEDVEIPAKKGPTKPKSGPVIVGDVVWIKEKKGEPWKCEVKAVNVKADTAKVTPIKGIAGHGKIFDVACSQLSHGEPK